MKCRTLGIRIEQPFAAIDEAAAGEFLSSVRVRKVTAAMFEAGEPAWSVMVFYDEEASAEAPREPGSPTCEEMRISDELKRWRSARASVEGVPPYCVVQNASIEQIARERPRTRDELAAIKGLGPARLEKYASEILALVSLEAEPAGGNAP